MKIKDHIESILKCKDFLSNHVDYTLLAKALAHLVTELDFYEKYVDNQNPFKQHFYATFRGNIENYDDCFAIQEDVVILFRVKALRVGIKNMSAVELEVLKDFEKTDHSPDSFVAKWYYEKIPMLIQKELCEGIGYNGTGWNSWWKKSIQGSNE